jgi:mono/diheme cytochrome c family protein
LVPPNYACFLNLNGGLFVTPLALAMACYVIPSVTRRPIYSHFISMMGFWLLFFLYPLNGTHHFVYSAIPMSAQRGAIIASVYLGLEVTLEVINLLLSLRGSSDKVGANVPLRGRDVFQHNCSGCHGVNADDHGIARPGLVPVPANLFHHHYSDADLATIIWNGVYGSAMPPWRQLDKADLAGLTAYVRSLQAPVATVSMSPQDSDAASKLFAANCVSCHGTHGGGDGPAAGALKPSPVNFHLRQPTADRASSVIERGIPGSSMPAWKGRLSDDERRLLARYVQSLYDGEPKEAQGR